MTIREKIAQAIFLADCQSADPNLKQFNIKKRYEDGHVKYDFLETEDYVWELYLDQADAALKVLTQVVPDDLLKWGSYSEGEENRFREIIQSIQEERLDAGECGKTKNLSRKLVDLS